MWPASRETHPKPFIRLADGETLLHKAYKRAICLKGVTNILTVTNGDLYRRTYETYAAFAGKRCRNTVICEPMRRNTAPAILMAALHAVKTQGPDVILLVLPADHLIIDQDGFETAVTAAISMARQGRIVTFGIQPTHPETSYGYIESDGSIVHRFVEKPPLDMARQFIADGRYLWNAGIFCFRASTLLDEFSIHGPDMLSTAMACYRSAVFDDGISVLHLSSDLFSAFPDISIDYAIMEKSARISVVPCDMGWSDIGSWRSMEQTIPADQDGNRIIGDAIMSNATNCYIESPYRAAGVADVSDLIIVDTPDAFLVARKESAIGIQHIFHRHKDQSLQRGMVRVLDDHENCRVQKYEIISGHSVPINPHVGTVTRWIVTAGTAHVSNGAQDFTVGISETILTDGAQSYHFKNAGDDPLVMIAIETKAE